MLLDVYAGDWALFLDVFADFNSSKIGNIFPRK